MDARYPIPAAETRTEDEILRSRFVTTLAHTPTVEAARAFVARVRAEFPDATHNCWAYVVGPPGSTAQIGLSDDGEPHGTAGRPMLTALLHSGVGEVGAVVTRYFGGTLLGKGGLVRAYAGGVTQALAQVPTIERVPKARLTLVFDYGALTPVRRLLPEHEAVVVAEEFAADVTLAVELPAERAAALAAALTDLTRGELLVSAE